MKEIVIVGEDDEEGEQPQRHVITNLDAIPYWVRVELAAICEQNKVSGYSGEVHITFARGHITKLSTTTERYPPRQQDATLPARKKQETA